MIKRDYDTLAAHIDTLSPSDLSYFSDTGSILLEAILVSAFEDETNRDQYLTLLDNFRSKSGDSPERFASILSHIGVKCYERQNPALAEWIYRLAMELSDSLNIRNNLAYILRRHRSDLNANHVEIMDLLMEGVSKQETFSLINMALHFALNLGTADDWNVADRLIQLVDADSAISAFVWWNDLAARQDPEGALLLHWLNRYNKLPFPLNDADPALISRITDSYSNVPAWFFLVPAED